MLSKMNKLCKYYSERTQTLAKVTGLFWFFSVFLILKLISAADLILPTLPQFKLQLPVAVVNPEQNQQ